MSGLAVAELGVAPTFITLGPKGTDHERATNLYIDFQGLGEVAKLDLINDFMEGVERVRAEPNSFLVQCSAHPKVHSVTERYPQEVVVVDDFIQATRDLSLLVRKDVAEPKSLGLVPATQGYPDLTQWKTIIDVQSKPVVSDRLLAGEFDAGLTFTELATDHPDLLRVAKNYGKVVTTWIVYGHKRHGRYAGKLIGEKIPWLFTGQPEPPTED
ncbi:MAG TPA: hypothetical protein VIJ68_02195 [Candidatus Saccharimonadales bacterium]